MNTAVFAGFAAEPAVVMPSVCCEVHPEVPVYESASLPTAGRQLDKAAAVQQRFKLTQSYPLLLQHLGGGVALQTAASKQS